MSALPNQFGKSSGFVGWQSPQRQTPKCEINNKQLLESINTGKVTINGLEKYCKWEISNCTEEQLKTALNENSLMFIGKSGDQPLTIKASSSASQTKTVNGAVVSQSNQSSSVDVSQSAESNIYSFMYLNTGGELHLHVSSTPYPAPIVKVLSYQELHQSAINAVKAEYDKALSTISAAAKK